MWGNIASRLSGKKLLVLSVALTAIGYVYNQALEGRPLISRERVDMACACMYAIAIACAGFAIGQGIDDLGEGKDKE